MTDDRRYDDTDLHDRRVAVDGTNYPRRVSPPAVERLRRDILAGDWQLADDARDTPVDPDAVLLDGHHRARMPFVIPEAALAALRAFAAEKNDAELAELVERVAKELDAQRRDV